MCPNGDIGLFCVYKRMSYFGTEEGFRQAVPIHDVHQVVENVVEDSMQLFPSESHALNVGQRSSMQIRLDHTYGVKNTSKHTEYYLKICKYKVSHTRTPRFSHKLCSQKNSRWR